MTENHDWLAAETRLVQVMPSGLVMTRLSVPEEATATKRPSPYVTDCQSLLAAEVPLVPEWVAVAPMTFVGCSAHAGSRLRARRRARVLRPNGCANGRRPPPARSSHLMKTTEYSAHFARALNLWGVPPAACR